MEIKQEIRENEYFISSIIKEEYSLHDDKSGLSLNEDSFSNPEIPEDAKQVVQYEIQELESPEKKDDQQYQCKMCQQIFSQKIQLTNHIFTHADSPEGFQCSYCDHHFSKASILNLHVKSNHRGFPPVYQGGDIPCTFCEKIFENPLQLSDHVMLKHKKREKRDSVVKIPFDCPICGTTITTRKYIRIHMANHGNEKDFECSICTRRFAVRKQLTRHMSTHKILKPFKCEVCEAGFTRKTHLESHMLRHGYESKHKCWICQKSCRNNSDLLLHMKTHRSSDSSKTATPANLSCPICFLGFELVRPLRRHLVVDHSWSPLQCHICLKEFQNRGTLKHHWRKHRINSRFFECALCSLRFDTKSQIQSHIISHSKDRPYGCSLCGDRFKRKSTFLKHSAVHSADQPFCCPICSKGFKLKGRLDVHIKIHTTIRHFVCSVCRKSFKTKDTLRQHMKIHDENLKTRFFCSSCPRSFCTKFLFKKHIKENHE
ncbi:hypothetical protein DMENIID0001_168590 [Sergentomyia squamirostris]